MNISTVLECRSLYKSYLVGPEKLPILKGLNLSIAAGELVSVMGASGAGKSTLLHLLGGLDKPDEGEVLINSVNLEGQSESELARLRNRSLGFVYQFHHLLPEFSAVENCMMPLLMRRESRKNAKEIAFDFLSKVGLAERANHRPSELSGGERQRVAVARALVGQPACVLFDEPTGNLDVGSAAAVLDLILELNQGSGISMVVVTHDPQIAARMHRHLRLSQGQLVEER